MSKKEQTDKNQPSLHPQMPAFFPSDYTQWMWQTGIAPGVAPPQSWPHVATAAWPGVALPHPSATPAVPRYTDDTLKVVKPKDPATKGIPSPVGIQSPKPNSPGFLLGSSSKDRAFKAFSPYSSRTNTPSSLAPTSSASLTDNSNAEIGTGVVDLTVKPEDKISSNSEKKDDGRKSAIPVGIAVARQRASNKDKTGSVEKKSPTITNAVTSTATSSLTSSWPPPTYGVPYMANPYHHYTIAQPAMSMFVMPQAAHRGVFAAGPMPFYPQPMQPAVQSQPTPAVSGLMMPELTIKTSTANVTAHASTSPNKPKSATQSPKSPLDKAKEKLKEIKAKAKKQELVSEKVSPVADELPPSHAINISSEKPERLESSDKDTSSPNYVKTTSRTSVKSDDHTTESVSSSASTRVTRQTSPKKEKTPGTKAPTTLSQSATDDGGVTKKHPVVERQKSKCDITSVTVRETIEISEMEDNVSQHDSEPAAPKRPPASRQKSRSKKRRQSSSRNVRDRKSSMRLSSETVVPLINPEEKEFLWEEDAMQPMIVKFDQLAYDVCQSDDLRAIEGKVRMRLQVVNKQIQEHKKHIQLYSDSSTSLEESQTNKKKRARSPLRSLEGAPKKVKSETSAEQKSPPKATGNPNSSFCVRSDSHPSLKMKAAAKAKSRKSESSCNLSLPSTPSKLEPLIPLTIPDTTIQCRTLSQEELLTTDSLILMCIEGLFYESRIKPIEPPDIFGIVIDGERHSKPRIFTQEELLSNTFTNVVPSHLTMLNIGTRVTAYWSEMIGCLYPGTVTALYPAANNHSKHLIDIEFDDGDSGKFPLPQIRMLPPNYPHVKYDTSSVLPVGRRRSSALPQVSPIMISPPSNRSVANLNRESVSKGRAGKTVDSYSEVFDESTDDDDTTEPRGREWKWSSTFQRKPSRGRGAKDYYREIARESEKIKIGDCAVFKTTGVNSLPYIGKILSMWKGWNGKMLVSVKWFYHPEELQDQSNLPKHKGALYESEHVDENDIQTIVSRCDVLTHEDYVKQKFHTRTAKERAKCNVFYLAGRYDAGRGRMINTYI